MSAVAVAVVVFEAAACLGFGAAALRAFKADAGLPAGEHWALSFGLGFGVLGWLMFPLGIAGGIGPWPLALLLAAGAAGVWLLPRPRRPSPAGLDGVGWLLLAAVAAVGAFDLLEAAAPPADADSLAYHFAVPRQVLAAGRLDFMPTPLEGAVPLLVQMTYVPALGLGGETALTLWTALSAWAAAGLLFALCRRHLGHNWSLAVTVAYLTTPAVIYGGGSGQVEARIALFALVAAWAVARALATGNLRFAALAGLAAGLFAAAKYTGLLFVAAAGAVLVGQLLIQRRRFLVPGAAFAVAAVAACFQWYAWNAVHTGDPAFPMLFQWLGRDDLAMWTKAHDLFFKAQYFGVEAPMPRTPLWLLAYPFAATLGFGHLLDAGRVGLGPYGLLVMPFAVLGAWRCRDRLATSPLLAYALIALVFYVGWFFVGGSQRIRHLLPVWPLFLLAATTAAERWSRMSSRLAPMAAAMAATVALQLGGHGLFAANYFRYFAGGADRQAFLARNVNVYFAVPWINANLKPTDRVLITERQLRYYLRVPSFFASYLQAMIELRPEATDAAKLYAELRRAGITHLLVGRGPATANGGYAVPFDKLQRTRCLVPLKHFEGEWLRSRTLPGLAAERRSFDVVRLAGDGCLG